MTTRRRVYQRDRSDRDDVRAMMKEQRAFLDRIATRRPRLPALTRDVARAVVELTTSRCRFWDYTSAEQIAYTAGIYDHPGTADDGAPLRLAGWRRKEITDRLRSLSSGAEPIMGYRAIGGSSPTLIIDIRPWKIGANHPSLARVEIPAHRAGRGHKRSAECSLCAGTESHKRALCAGTEPDPSRDYQDTPAAAVADGRRHALATPVLSEFQRMQQTEVCHPHLAVEAAKQLRRFGIDALRAEHPNIDDIVNHLESRYPRSGVLRHARSIIDRLPVAVDADYGDLF